MLLAPKIFPMPLCLICAKKLQKFGSDYDTRVVPGGKIRQVHAYDPDGNHVEIAFSTREQADPNLLRGE